MPNGSISDAELNSLATVENVCQSQSCRFGIVSHSLCYPFQCFALPWTRRRGSSAHGHRCRKSCSPTPEPMTNSQQLARDCNLFSILNLLDLLTEAGYVATLFCCNLQPLISGVYVSSRSSCRYCTNGNLQVPTVRYTVSNMLPRVLYDIAVALIERDFSLRGREASGVRIAPSYQHLT